MSEKGVKHFFLVSTCNLAPLQDQYDQIEKHTQSGIDLLDLYVKFVKERTEIEQSYAKQLRCVCMLLCLPLTVLLRCEASPAPSNK